MKKSLIIFIAFFVITNTGTLAQNMANGWEHSIIICQDSTLKSWGTNQFGQLGTGNNSATNLPVSVVNIDKVLKIATCTYSNLAVKSDSTLWMWGLNDQGQLGNNSLINSSIPIQVSGLTSIVAIAAGNKHSLAVKKNGTVWAWGSNNFGELGDNTTVDRLIPIQINSLSNIISVAAGWGSSIALKDDGTVWSWGKNNQGELGNGTFVPSLIPNQISTLNNIVAISAGSSFYIALKSDGSVWTWGINTAGQLGNGTYINSNVPVNVLGVSNITAISAGGNSPIVLRNDSTLWAWGFNSEGQLGDGTTITRNVPGIVPNFAGIIYVCKGLDHTVAIKSNGTEWSWGKNDQGQLGIGNFIQQNSPALINGLCFPLVYSSCVNTASSITVQACDSFLAPNGIVYTTSGIKTAIIQNIAGCDSTITINLTINITPILNLTSSFPSICQGKSSTLNVTGGSSYTWSPAFGLDSTSGSTVIASPTTNITYTVISASVNGCIPSAQILLKVNSNPLVNITKRDISCFGNSDGSATANVIGGTFPYSYTWNNNSNSSQINSLSSGSYSVQVSDSNNCQANSFVIISEPSELQGYVTSKPATCPEEADGSAKVFVSGGTPPYNFLWSTNDNTITLNNLNQGSYEVTISDSNFCKIQKQTIIGITREFCLLVPSGFTPNGDGINDTWEIIGIDKYPNAEISIRNRWGQEIFKSNSFTDQWNGNFNGNQLPVADYFYVIKLDNVQNPLTGTVTLKR